MKQGYTNTNEFRERMKRYFLENMDFTGYRQNPKTDEEKFRALFEIYYSEVGSHSEKQKSRQYALAEWLSGVPSIVSIPVYNWDVIALAQYLGTLPIGATEKEEDRIIENYYPFMGLKLLQIFDRYKIG